MNSNTPKLAISLAVVVRPFDVPDSVRRVDDGDPIPLNMLGDDDLNRLCAEFKHEVFRKAGKQLMVMRDGPGTERL